MKIFYFLPVFIMSNVIAMDPAPVTIIHAEQGKLYGDMKKGPMNSDWFYSEITSHDTANKLHQLCKWKEAAEEYRKAQPRLLLQHVKYPEKNKQIMYIPTEQESIYAKHMGLVNWAACLMAQRQASEHWKSFDYLIGIPKEKRISGKMIKACELRDKLVEVKTGKVGIGDIFLFMHGAVLLKQSTGCYIVFSVRDFLKDTLSSFATAYDISIVGENENQPKTDYETHIISLLGHLELKPADVIPPRVVLTAPERAMIAVSQQVQPFLALGKTIMAVFLGENRQATLIGGKQLPRDPKDHGRHLDSEPFRVLLQKHPHLLLMDCGTKDSRVAIDENQKNKYVQLASEEQAFDTTIALALFMNIHKKIIAFGADNGPINVFARALDKEAQKRMAFIIPNGSKNHGEYDMRMEGEGQVYKHMLYDNVSVYKCADPSQQTEVINMAYDDIIEQNSHPIVYSFTIGKEDLKAVTLVHQ